MKLVWSATATRELAKIADYIGPRNAAAATRVEVRLRKAVEHLQQYPRAGRIGRNPNTREIVIAEFPYIIRYRVLDDQIQILRIFHAAMSWADF